MFSRRSLRGEAITADYAKQRGRLEPLVEITQYKGDSETHPDLSPDDEFADFGLYPWYIQKVRTDNYQPRPGDYVRSALKTGLELETTALAPMPLGLSDLPTATQDWLPLKRRTLKDSGATQSATQASKSNSPNNVGYRMVNASVGLAQSGRGRPVLLSSTRCAKRLRYYWAPHRLRFFRQWSV